MDAEETDFYFTLSEKSDEVLFKDRGSKFFGNAFPVKTEEEIKEYLELLKSNDHKAGHFCYAWRLGEKYEHYRANDDGEPSNSAGIPIYGQIQSFEITNVLVVVRRHFGGTKLGIPGLINAYRTTAKMALENASIVRKTINFSYLLTFDYPVINTVMRVIKEHNLTILDQVLELNCRIFISVRKKDSEDFFLVRKHQWCENRACGRNDLIFCLLIHLF